MATELILIRHGNAVRVNGDYVHAPLTALGQEQAAQTGQYFSAPAEPSRWLLLEPSAPHAGDCKHYRCENWTKARNCAVEYRKSACASCLRS